MRGVATHDDLADLSLSGALQRNDIAMAITKFDQFDFLIDIVPRDDLKPPKRQVRRKWATPPASLCCFCFPPSDWQPGSCCKHP